MDTMDKINSKLTSVKDHLKKHRFTYAASAVAIAAIALQQKNLKDFYAFLEERGIDPVEFYMSEDLIAEM